MNLCIIPARGGSKRIPRKNIKEFCGKPLISYSIEIAKKSKLFSKIVVSTDDEEIAKISKIFGAEILYRPKELADDYIGSTEVFEHAINELNKNNKFKYACMIYPTAPLLKTKYLKEGLEKLKNSDACFSFSATTFDFPIWRSFGIVENKAKMFFSEFENKRSQDLKEAYHDAGQFYWKKLSCSEKFSFNGSIPIIIPRYLVQDIDTMEDFIRAEKLYKIEYQNSFDKWNELKQKLHKEKKDLFIREREIYFLHLGKNIGYEQNGKNDKFLRPILVYKKLSHNLFLGIPLTSKEKKGNYYYKFNYKPSKISYALLNQIRVFDTKRICYKSGTIKRRDFKIIEILLQNIFTHQKGGIGTSPNGVAQNGLKP